MVEGLARLVRAGVHDVPAEQAHPFLSSTINILGFVDLWWGFTNDVIAGVGGVDIVDGVGRNVDTYCRRYSEDSAKFEISSSYLHFVEQVRIL